MAVLDPAQMVRALQGRDPRERAEVSVLALGAQLVDGFDADDPSTVHAPSMIVAPIVNPIVTSLLTMAGASTIGATSFRVGLGYQGDGGTVMGLAADVLAAGQLFPEPLVRIARGQDYPALSAVGGHDVYHRLNGMFQGTPAGQAINGRRDRLSRYMPQEGAASLGTLLVDRGGDTLYLRLATQRLQAHLEDCDEDLAALIELDLRQAGRSVKKPKPVQPAVAVAVLEYFHREFGVPVVDLSLGNDLWRIRHQLARTITTWPKKGQPAKATVAVGGRLPEQVLRAAHLDGPDHDASAVAILDASAQEIVVAADVLHALGQPSGLSDAVIDVGRMALAAPHLDERLRVYQQEAVGLHLATKHGYLNACAPGLGKTVMSLTAMSLRAQHIERYRGLVVVEANVRPQWAGEAEIWFPEARVVVLNTAKDVRKLVAAHEDDDPSPLLVISSYAMIGLAAEVLAAREAEAKKAAEDKRKSRFASLLDLFTAQEDEDRQADAPAEEPEQGAEDEAPEAAEAEAIEMAEGISDEEEEISAGAAARDHLGQVLLTIHWHDLIADEAATLRNPSSKQSKALWGIRANTDIAVGLTGTPITRGLDDIGRLLSWVRGTPGLFDGRKLSDQFDVTTDEGMHGYADAVGPLVFRRDKSEISNEIPETRANVLKIETPAAQLNLSNAATVELRRLYDEVLSLMVLMESTDPDSEEIGAVRQALAEARAACVGGTTLARMAASDPAALLESDTAAVRLLESQGLVSAATAERGAKRAAVVDLTVDRVVEGKKVIIFTGWSTVARGLVDDLRERGLSVGECFGGAGKRRDRHVEAFKNGELDVLVATSAGEKGLNLQIASVVVHYDLPWTPDSVVQRTGRVERIGADHDEIELVFPIMEGTIEERVAGLVVSRALIAMRALDTSRGVDAVRTEMGRSLAGLVGAINLENAGKHAGMLEMTRQVLAA